MLYPLLAVRQLYWGFWSSNIYAVLRKIVRGA
jgi:hypothetical protein